MPGLACSPSCILASVVCISGEPAGSPRFDTRGRLRPDQSPQPFNLIRCPGLTT
ncbi:hypothetical protein [Lysobacter gummosus]|uniref:hypothetical protein n=1 Tax=Lysobacter gummosus TaxID=262324 RepID=UPI003629DB6C